MGDHPAVPHFWGDAYYGVLYHETTRGLLTPALSALEVERMAELLALRRRDRVLDLACGTGRHLPFLAKRVGRLYGLERSFDYARLAKGQGSAHLLRGDVRALPLRDGALDAAVSWYASLFMFDDPTNEACLRELARVLAPGGRLLVHHANPLALAAEPEARAEAALPGGARVEEESRFDAGSGRDRGVRRLIRVNGECLSARYDLRYYTPAEWPGLLARCGMRLAELASSVGPFGPGAPDLIAVARRQENWNP